MIAIGLGLEIAIGAEPGIGDCQANSTMRAICQCPMLTGCQSVGVSQLGLGKDDDISLPSLFAFPSTEGEAVGQRKARRLWLRPALAKDDQGVGPLLKPR